MNKINEIIKNMHQQPNNIRFADLSKVCKHYFGAPRQTSGSHQVYKTPWQGDPRINIQKSGNKAKAYQVRQVLQAIKKLEEKNAT